MLTWPNDSAGVWHGILAGLSDFGGDELRTDPHDSVPQAALAEASSPARWSEREFMMPVRGAMQGIDVLQAEVERPAIDRSPALESYCGGGWTGWAGCCLSCLSCLSLPPPKIFCRKFLFLGGAGCWVVSGAFPSGGVFGAVRTMGAPVVDAGRVASGVADLLPPMPKIFWMKFCGFSPIWLQVLTGAVPSRKAT
jgi:hypothetical protein